MLKFGYNELSLVERACTIRVENKDLEGKAVMSSARLYCLAISRTSS